MRNHLNLSLALTLFLAAVFALSAWNTLDAKGKKGKKKKGDKGKQEEKAEEVKPVEPVWPSPLDPGLVDPVFKELPFNQDSDKLLAGFAQRLTEQLQPVLRATMNPSERDDLNAKLKKTVDSFSKSLIEFTGQQTGYAVSVVGDEFAPHAAESLYKYAYNENTAYFFLTGNTFWKLFICSETMADYPALLERLKQAYGEPLEITWKDEEKTEAIAALWKDTTFELRAMPPKGIFVCSRLVWTYLPLLDTVAQRRAATATGPIEDTSGDSIIDQITSDTGENNDDVIDKILKKKKEK